MQKLDDCQVVISESPDATAEWCKTHRPNVLLMEVKAYSPWMFKERMAIRDKVKRNTESCRVILFVDDDTDEDLTEKVRQAKREGLIDAFLFGSVSENYFASVIDSVYKAPLFFPMAERQGFFPGRYDAGGAVCTLPL